MADYIPHSDDAMVTWLSNFKAKLAIHAATLEIKAEDVTIHQDECDKLTTDIQAVAAQKKALANIAKVKKETRADVVGNLRSLNNRIKTHPAYTESIGAALGILPVDSIFNTDTAKPVLTVLLSGGKPVISFSKEKSNGIKIYSKRSGEAAFSFLALDTHSPYHDNRDNAAAGTPEHREYYAFYIDNTDEAFGLQSDTISIMVS